jgi:hypothetical protein
MPEREKEREREREREREPAAVLWRLIKLSPRSALLVI